MKKVENLLVFPILALFILTFFDDTSTLDIHLHDTYYVIANTSKIFVSWLVIVFLLYKTIRWRNKYVNPWWFFSHTGLTVVLIGWIYYFLHWLGNPPNTELFFNMDALKRWEFYNQVIKAVLLSFLLAQLVFLIYFITRLFKKT